MNEKALVTKDLNAKHTKILEGLLRLPGNKECADCRSKAPRWASVNLGVFICMQCSGIHRSLGVHISKVRSATLDTWLPEQVAFLQRMGNIKCNDYWEADLPPDYNRSPIERFIRAKYVEKRWAMKNAMPPRPLDDMTSVLDESFDSRSRDRIIRKTRKLSLEEEILAKHVTQIVPPRQRGHSLDIRVLSPNMGRPPLGELDTSSKVNDGPPDLYTLLNSLDSEKQSCSRTPSSWATFECKIHQTSQN